MDLNCVYSSRRLKEIKHAIFAVMFMITMLGCTSTAQKEDNPLPNQDTKRFAAEYPLVGSDNLFVFRNAAETADILANGTGVVFIGFKECPWCQRYAVYLNDAAKESGLARIFYCDILEDRQNNTADYQRIVSILSGALQYDDEGRPRVFVPDVTVINNGKIVGRDYESSKDTLGYEKPEEYWTGERVSALKERLMDSMSQIHSSCNLCNY